jgi:hypothetical protein
MARSGLIALSLLLLAGCTQDGSPLFPELKGRWAPEKGTRARLVLASKDSSVPIVAPTLKELCENEYLTFEKYQGTDFNGGVILHRKGNRETVFMIANAAREGARIILTGQEPGNPLAGPGRTRLELVLRNGEVAFDNLFDQRGRSVRYDSYKAPDSVSQQRAGLNTIGDLFRVLFDLKPCA